MKGPGLRVGIRCKNFHEDMVKVPQSHPASHSTRVQCFFLRDPKP